MPVRIWLEGESGSVEVQEAVKNLLNSQGFTVVRAYPAQQGRSNAGSKGRDHRPGAG